MFLTVACKHPNSLIWTLKAFTFRQVVCIGILHHDAANGVLSTIIRLSIWIKCGNYIFNYNFNWIHVEYTHCSQFLTSSKHRIKLDKAIFPTTYSDSFFRFHGSQYVDNETADREEERVRGLQEKWEELRTRKKLIDSIL